MPQKEYYHTLISDLISFNLLLISSSLELLGTHPIPLNLFKTGNLRYLTENISIIIHLPLTQVATFSKVISPSSSIALTLSPD